MRGLARFLYTHNPFYLISAACVMYGLRQMFPPSTATVTDIWFLAKFLACYTVLLAVTACLIVRFGKVWDDARTIALLVVLMCLTFSTGFDHLSFDYWETAFQIALFGWGYMTVVLELMGIGMGVRVKHIVRIPLHLLTGFFFLYPVMLTSEYWDSTTYTMPWRVLLFPTLAGLLSLSLLPAARTGRRLVSRSRTPWSWPYFPWTVFIMLAIGVLGRSYLLTLSFQYGEALDSTFGGYYLVPLLACCFLVTAEIGLAERCHRTLKWLAFSPAVLLVLSSWHTGAGPYQQFLREVTTSIGSPFFIAILISVFFSLYLWGRGVRQAKHSLFALGILVCFVGPQTGDWGELSYQRWWPLALVAIHQWTSLIEIRSSWQFVKANAVTNAVAYLAWEGEPWFSMDLLIVAAIVALISSAFLFEDALARQLRRVLPLFATGASVLVAYLAWFKQIQIVNALVVLLGISLLMLGIWRIYHLRLYHWTSLACQLVLQTYGLAEASLAVREMIPRKSFDALAMGGACFVIGAAVSSLKAGAASGLSTSIKRQLLELRIEWHKLGRPPRRRNSPTKTQGPETNNSE